MDVDYHHNARQALMLVVVPMGMRHGVHNTFKV